LLSNPELKVDAHREERQDLEPEPLEEADSTIPLTPEDATLLNARQYFR
jgi:hypothetical protein